MVGGVPTEEEGDSDKSSIEEGQSHSVLELALPAWIVGVSIVIGTVISYRVTVRVFLLGKGKRAKKEAESINHTHKKQLLQFLVMFRWYSMSRHPL